MGFRGEILQRDVNKKAVIFKIKHLNSLEEINSTNSPNMFSIKGNTCKLKVPVNITIGICKGLIAR